MSQSIYKSHTHGPIPLSECGKKLLQELRVAIQEAIQKGDYNQADGVAYARGELAKYMSYLEARQPKAWPAEAYSKLWTDMMYQGSSTGRWSGGKLSGNLAQSMIIDDPLNKQELDMSKKAVAIRKKAASAEAKMQLVGIRFLTGHNLDKIYTYKVKRSAKLTLGCEVVARNSNGTSVGVVVQLDPEMPLQYSMESLTELTARVAAI